MGEVMRQALGMCFSWRVIGLLATVGIAIMVFTPAWGLAMRKMNRHGGEVPSATSPQMRDEFSFVLARRARLEADLMEADLGTDPAPAAERVAQ